MRFLLGSFLTLLSVLGGEIVEVSQQTFNEIVLQAKKPVVVDFYALWCGPCRRFAPTYEKMESACGNEIIFAKFNVGERGDRSVWNTYELKVVPSFFFYKDGKLVARENGTVAEEIFYRHFKEDFKINCL